MTVPGPYGDLGSRSTCFRASTRVLRAMRLDYVDIFYHHRPTLSRRSRRRWAPSTRPSAKQGGLCRGQQLPGGAHRAGDRDSAAPRHAAADPPAALLMLDRWIEAGLLDGRRTPWGRLDRLSPLAQGLLTDRYLDGVPADSRVRIGEMLDAGALSDETLGRVRALNEIAQGRANRWPSSRSPGSCATSA